MNIDFLSINNPSETEFRAWYSKDHQDGSTYKRIHADPKSGEWFFHYSGVDIALKMKKLLDMEGF